MGVLGGCSIRLGWCRRPWQITGEQMASSATKVLPRGKGEGNGIAATCGCTSSFSWEKCRRGPSLTTSAAQASFVLCPVPVSSSVKEGTLTNQVLLPQCHFSTETAILGVLWFATAQKVCLKALQRNWNQTNFRWSHKWSWKVTTLSGRRLCALLQASAKYQPKITLCSPKGQEL